MGFIITYILRKNDENKETKEFTALWIFCSKKTKEELNWKISKNKPVSVDKKTLKEELGWQVFDVDISDVLEIRDANSLEIRFKYKDLYYSIWGILNKSQSVNIYQIQLQFNPLIKKS